MIFRFKEHQINSAETYISPVDIESKEMLDHCMGPRIGLFTWKEWEKLELLIHMHGGTIELEKLS